MDNLSISQRKYCMSRIKSKNTKPEMAVRKILTRLGYRYRLHNLKMPGKPDIILSKFNTIFLINGCFWHQHNNCKRQAVPKSNTAYWDEKLKRNIDKQTHDIRKLKELGWKVRIIWECQTSNEKSLEMRLRKYL